MNFFEKNQEVTAMIIMAMPPPTKCAPSATALSANIPNIFNPFFSVYSEVSFSDDLSYVFIIIYVRVAAPKVSPPIVRNKLNIILSPFIAFRFTEIYVFIYPC